MTGDNGLLTKAGQAKNTNLEAEGLERIQLAVMASHDDRGINTTSLAKNLSQINGLTDTNNKAISEISEIMLPTIITINDTQYMIKESGSVVKADYCRNGLILHLDGINNTRNGHSTTTTTWEDLSGNNNDFTKLSSASNTKWNDNSYVGDATNRTLVLEKAILENATECSVEVCYDIPQLGGTNWIFQSRQTNYNTKGFQFAVGQSRGLTLFADYNIYNSMKTIDLGKKTIAFAVDSEEVKFSDNSQFYTETTKEGIIESLTQRTCYTIGGGYPWLSYGLLNGNIYSIRIYNRKLSEEELKTNYIVDKIRFNID